MGDPGMAILADAFAYRKSLARVKFQVRKFPALGSSRVEWPRRLVLGRVLCKTSESSCWSFDESRRRGNARRLDVL